MRVRGRDKMDILSRDKLLEQIRKMVDRNMASRKNCLDMSLYLEAGKYDERLWGLQTAYDMIRTFPREEG
jgi:hypothetical protein